MASAQFLGHYARQMRSVEVNTSFYALPDPKTLIRWVESVPHGFTFALKFPRRISHELRLVTSEAESLAMLDVLRALGGAAAPAFLQLPPDFTRAREGRVLAAYLDWLATAADDVRIAVEVRAPDLMTEAFARFLAERGFAFVLVDRKGTPDVFEQVVAYGQTVGFAFIRWIGDDRTGPKGDRELVAPQDDALERWAARIADLHGDGVDVFGYMHNPYEGHAPASVRRLEARLAMRLDLPQWLPQTEEAAAAESHQNQSHQVQSHQMRLL
jgi:uncharacterized protein YecE (DUF72 family)